MKILLVDDTPENLVSLEAALEGLGEELVMAQSGEGSAAAICLKTISRPSCWMCKHAGNGRVRDGGADSQPAAVAADSDSVSDRLQNEEHLFRGYDLGAVDFLFKPIVPEVLRSKVAVFVELSRSNAKLRQQADALRKQAVELQRVEQEVRRLNAGLEARVLEGPRN